MEGSGGLPNEEIANPPSAEQPSVRLPRWILPLVILIFLSALFGAGLAGYQYYSASREQIPQLHGLQQQVDQLTAQVKDLQGQVGRTNDLLQKVTDAIQRQAGPSAPGAARAQINTEGQPSLGATKAPVVIVEFSDYQCPFCARFELQTFPRLKADYIDSGKVRLVFRDFPLIQLHPNAELAAEAAACAEEQGAYWPMHDMLFHQQAEWAPGSGVDKVFDQYAQSLGLKTTQFADCLTKKRYSQGISQDMQEGLKLGVQGTPTFFINGQSLVGAIPYEDFKQLIDADLASPQAGR
jgi:protein-disulfide isomerase